MLASHRRNFDLNQWTLDERKSGERFFKMLCVKISSFKYKDDNEP